MKKKKQVWLESYEWDFDTLVTYNEKDQSFFIEQDGVNIAFHESEVEDFIKLFNEFVIETLIR